MNHLHSLIFIRIIKEKIYFLFYKKDRFIKIIIILKVIKKREHCVLISYKIK